MKERLKEMLAVLIVIILLPYVLTVIFSGTEKDDILIENHGQTMIRVSYDNIETSMELEEYLIGVIAMEMPYSYEKEALKAQAVAARSMIVARLQEAEAQGTQVQFDEPYLSMEKLKKLVGSTEFDQIYKKLQEAVAETAGEVLTYDGVPAGAPFHAVSAGKTRSGSEIFQDETAGYLAVVDSSRDQEADNYLKLTAYSPEKLVEKCQEEYPKIELSSENILSQIEILTRDEADYVVQIRVGSQTMSGEMFRNILGLNSSCFTLQEHEGNIRILTKGLGHGMGMSQYGANRMAGEGTGYQDILNYYYQNIKIETIPAQQKSVRIN